jgi:hypothetical protein
VQDVNLKWRSWLTHNLLAHPLSEILAWCGEDGERIGEWLHDSTLPEHEFGTGRG